MAAKTKNVQQNSRSGTSQGLAGRALQRLKDWRHERCIQRRSQQAIKAAQAGRYQEAHCAWDQVRTLHASRSPEQIARMEKSMEVRRG